MFLAVYSTAHPRFRASVLCLGAAGVIGVCALAEDVQVAYEGTIEISASSIVFDRNGNLFACGSGQEGERDLGSKRLRIFSGGVAIAIDNDNRTVYVAESSGVIKRFDGQGKLVASSTSGAKSGSWFPDAESSPCRGLAVHDGALYLSCYYEGKVKKAKLDLTDRGPKTVRNGRLAEATLDPRDRRSAGALEPGVDPAANAIDKDAAATVTDAEKGKAGRPGELAETVTGLFRPCGIAFDKKGGFYVALEGSHRVRNYDTTKSPWKMLWEVGSVATRGRKQFRGPRGLCVEGGHLYVADMYNHRIKVYTLNGELVGTFGSHGSGNLEFRVPTDIALCTVGNTSYAAVTDANNRRIQRYRLSFQKQPKRGAP